MQVDSAFHYSGLVKWVPAAAFSWEVNWHTCDALAPCLLSRSISWCLAEGYRNGYQRCPLGPCGLERTTCMLAMLRAGIVFGDIYVCTCSHKISTTTHKKSTKLGRSMPHGERWAIYFGWLYLANSFSVWRYMFRISRSQFSFKVMAPMSRSQQRKSGSVQLKNYWS